MDISGERRFPAERQVVWNAISDWATLRDSLPSGLSIAPQGDGSHALTYEGVDGATWRTRIVGERVGPAQSVFGLSPASGDRSGFGGRAEITMAEDGVFTRVLWRLAADLPEAERASVATAVEHVLSNLGQRAATPAPVAAQGVAGATAALVNAAPLPVGGSLLAALGKALAGMPRDATIGGAVFILVAMFVVGIL